MTWVGRNFGYGVARAYAGHEGGIDGAGVPATYVRADVQEVAAALSALTGQAHPLAPVAGTGTGQAALIAPPEWWRPALPLVDLDA